MLDLPAVHRALVQEIVQRQLPGREVRAFGSRVTGNAKPYSDLDLVIMGADRLDDRQRADLHEAFDQSDLPCRIDILEWVDAPESLRAHIRQHAIPL